MKKAIVIMSGLEDGDMGGYSNELEYIYRNPKNFSEFCRKIGCDIIPYQTSFMVPQHGCGIDYAPNPGNYFTDGLFTDRNGIFLRLNPADCLAVIFQVYNKSEKLVGIALAHAGREGTKRQISVKMLERLSVHFGSGIFFKVGFSPYIGSCCHRFKVESLVDRSSFYSLDYSVEGEVGIDLLSENIFQLTKLHTEKYDVYIPTEQLRQICTCCGRDIRGRYKFPSYRRSQKNKSYEESEKRFAVVMGME